MKLKFRMNEISPVNKLTYSFEYDYFQGTESALPTGYIYNDIGTTHQKRLKLTGVNTPWGEKFSFFYDESGTMPTRLTYGIDHWGWANGAETNLSNPYGFVGSQFFAPEASTCGSNRAANFSFAKRGILTRIESSLGAKTSLTYEAHALGSTYPAVGGVRVKSVLQEDPLLNTAIEKKYSYTLADNSSSGVAFLEPSYRVSYNNSGLIIFSHSNLFSSLLAESGRPEAAYSRVIEETQVLGNSPSSGKTITEFDFDPNFGTTRQLPWIACSNCPDNPVYFNLNHDYSQGAVKKQEIYNQSNQLISKTELQYTPNRGMKYDSTLAFRYYNSSYSFPGYSGNYWMSVSYYLPFKKFRVKSQTSTLYNPNGTGIPSIATTTITYKDEMPLAYREKYKGKHNMPVKITTEDEEGNIIERNLLYTGDFGFDMEQVIVCPIDFPCPIDQLCPGPECQEIEYTVHVPPYSSDGRGIFESLARNILNTPVETRETINGQTVSSAYLALHSGNNSFITLPKSVYQLKTVPKTGFSEASYYQPSLSMVKDVDYGTDPISEVLSYNTKGHPIDSKITKGVTSRVAYLNPTISNGSIHNLGKPDALTESLAFGKIYLGANRSIAPNLLEKKVEHNPLSGQVLVEKDKDNRVLRRYDYHLDLGAVSSVSWNELAFIKLCSGGNVTVGVSINGLTSSAIAQFSTDGGVTWQNANVGSNAFNYTRTAGTGTQEIRARASDAPSNVIITNRDISCDTPVAFNWGPYSVATLEVGPPRVCQYNVSVVGLTSGGTAQFSIDNGASWLNANVGTTQMQYALFANPSIQEFWARDSNNPTNVIYGTLNVCN